MQTYIYLTTLVTNIIIIASDSIITSVSVAAMVTNITTDFLVARLQMSLQLPLLPQLPRFPVFIGCYGYMKCQKCFAQNTFAVLLFYWASHNINKSKCANNWHMFICTISTINSIFHICKMVAA